MWNPPPLLVPNDSPLRSHSQDEAFDQQNSTKKVHFYEKNTVIEIPNKGDYSDSTRKNLWTSFREIKTNAKRNRVEFQADGCDWRKCKEESEMLFQNGKLIHPASYQKTIRSKDRRIKATQRKVVRASRILTERTLQKLLAERANHPCCS
jgi:hypothetical protein